MKSSFVERIQVLAKALKHPECPWYAKVVIGLTLAMALSPIDLIPDFIPLLGHLDDLLLIPLGIAIAYALIPKEIIQQVEEEVKRKKEKLPRRYALWGAGLIVVGYGVLIAIVVMVIIGMRKNPK